MWLLSHISGGTTRLKPDTTYTIGRDLESDIVVNSGLVSRNQLEVQLGTVDVCDNALTPLKVGVLSRARSVINEEVYKLSKGAKDPIWIDLAKQARTEIKFRMDDNTEQVSVVIEWKDFILYATEDIEKLRTIDLRVTREVAEATHYYQGAADNKQSLLIALVRGIPILNKKWLQATSGDIKDWFLEPPLANFASNTNLIPDSRRATLFNDLHFIDINHKHANVLKHFKCKSINLTGNEENIISEIRSQGKCLIMEDSTIPAVFATLNVNPTTYSDLLQSIKSISTANLSFYTAKRDHTQESQPMRKRRKYEKVDKMHFFDFNATSQKAPSEKSTPEVEETTENNKEIAHTSDDHTIPREDVGVKVEDQPTKRPLSDAEEVRPHKIPKYTPKVSLIDAIKQTKEDATKTTNEELGIGKLDVVSDLSNLAIVEEIEFQLRTPPASRLESNSKYRGRKNFKKFTKNMKMESSVTRSFIDLSIVTIDNEINFVDSKAGDVVDVSNTEQKLTKDFSGLMNEVKGFRSEGLFVDDESDDEQSYTKTKQPTLFVNEDSQPTQSKPKARQSNNLFIQISVDVDDDDDDDDEHPKFGFSR